MHTEKQVSYTQTNTYSTLNNFTENTRNIWFVSHGLGHLSSYFIKHFEHLNPEQNYVVAPQAPSKYYQDKSFKYVGASWFTRKYLEQETQNINNYLDAVYQTEVAPKRSLHTRLILLGYSQGVSAISRWLAASKIDCDTLLFHSGTLPKELKVQDFTHLKDLRVVLAYGNKDEYLNERRLKVEIAYYKKVFGSKIECLQFEGKHELNPQIIKAEAKNFI